MAFEFPLRRKEIPSDPYDEQFKNPEVLQVEGGRVEVVDLKPETEKTDTPLVLVPGFGATATTMKENAKLLAKEGRRVIGLSAPHGTTPDKMKHEDAPHAELRKAESVILALDERNIARADVFTHSEGALFVTYAALAHPDRFRNIIYYAPAGLIGEDSFWELAQRISIDAIDQFRALPKEQGRKERLDVISTEVLKAALGQPGRTLEQAKAIAASQIQENLRELREKGVGITIMHPVGDKAFPMLRMQEMVKGDMVDGFISIGDPSGTGAISDTHNAIYLSPEKYTPAIDAVLDTMERNWKHRHEMPGEESAELEEAA